MNCARKCRMADIEKNARTYEAQVFKILDPKKTEVVFNSHWLNKLTPQDLLELSAHSTVAQMLARADFKKRFESGQRNQFAGVYLSSSARVMIPCI